MSFFDIISKLFEKFIKDNNEICDQIMSDLFNIEGDINKLYTVKKKHKKFHEDIDIIFTKHISNNNIYNLYKSTFQKLKLDICDICTSLNTDKSTYYDELIKVNKYNIQD